MPAYRKWLVGWVAALALGWAAYGPIGRGEAFVERLGVEAERVLAHAELEAVEVRFPTDPLRRSALLSGPADDFQREGQGRFPGINDRILAIPGVRSVRWADEPDFGPSGLPLIVETLALVSLAFLVGAALGAFLFRRRGDGFLQEP